MSNVRSANKVLKIFWVINKQKAVTIRIGFPSITLLKVKSRPILVICHRFILKFHSFRSFASQKSKPTQISSEQWCQRNKQRWRSCIQWKWWLNLLTHVGVCVSHLCDREKKGKQAVLFCFYFISISSFRFFYLYLRCITEEQRPRWIWCGDQRLIVIV